MLVFSCKEAALAASKSLDAHLPLHQRLGLWMHLAMCGMCRRYVGQLHLLRKAVRYHFALEAEARHGPSLPPEAKERLRKKMAKAKPDS